MSYKIRNGETILLVKVAKIIEGDIQHKYVCGWGGIIDHRMAIAGQLE